MGHEGRVRAMRRNGGLYVVFPVLYSYSLVACSIQSGSLYPTGLVVSYPQEPAIYHHFAMFPQILGSPWPASLASQTPPCFKDSLRSSKCVLRTPKNAQKAAKIEPWELKIQGTIKKVKHIKNISIYYVFNTFKHWVLA